jgi:hypothetical protein
MQDRMRTADICSRSASGSTMAEDFPPSSRVTGRSSSPQAAAIRRPTAVDPVNATLAVSGWRTRVSPTAPEPVTMLTTPAGTPAASTASSTNRMDSGVDGAGLTTTVHPARSAGASLTTTRLIGKFHGAMSTQTPTGSRRTSDSAPPVGNARRSSSSR